jgi:opacity protein-like surface antigen
LRYPSAGPAFTRIVAAGFLSASLAMLVPPVAALAGDPQNAIGKPAAGPPDGPPQWTVFVGAIVLGRTGGVSRTLVERMPGSEPFYSTFTGTGPEAFNSSQFQQGLSAGPKIDLTYRGESGYGAELSYFNIFNQSATNATGPDIPADWLVMKAPGAFWQTQDFPYQAMVWKDVTNLYSAEANGRLALSSRVTVLAGFRWIQLNDTLQGTLSPADRTAPAWKQSCGASNCTLTDVAQAPLAGSAGSYPPFWTTSTTNNLYGVQIGVDGTIFEYGRFSVGGQVKLGLFDNNAQQSTGVSLEKVVYPASATANRPAFASEVGLQVKYQVWDGLAVQVGYEALWLVGVALAPGQIQETLTTASRAPVHPLGVETGSNVMFHGFTAGLSYSF